MNSFESGLVDPERFSFAGVSEFLDIQLSAEKEAIENSVPNRASPKRKHRIDYLRQELVQSAKEWRTLWLSYHEEIDSSLAVAYNVLAKKTMPKEPRKIETALPLLQELIGHYQKHLGQTLLLLNELNIQFEANPQTETKAYRERIRFQFYNQLSFFVNYLFPSREVLFETQDEIKKSGPRPRYYD